MLFITGQAAKEAAVREENPGRSWEHLGIDIWDIWDSYWNDDVKELVIFHMGFTFNGLVFLGKS